MDHCPGKPAYEMLESDPDWVPCLYLGGTEVEAANTDRFKWPSGRRVRRSQQQQPPSPVSNNTGPQTELDNAAPSYPDLIREFEQSEDQSEDDDEHDGGWLFELQEIRGSCDPNPCLNNGVCEEKRRGKIKCDCPKSYKGRRCERVKRSCKHKTCGYGTCVVTSTPPFYECKCKEPFKPPKCEAATTCQHNPCQNGGKCVQEGRDFDCVCPDNYDGRFCQVGPDDCYKGNGESYRGKVSETGDGDECLYWNSYFLLERGVNPFSTFEDADGLGPHNFCRNPDGDVKPWCFIRKGRKLRWEHCDVRKCSDDVTTPPTTKKPKPATTKPIPTDKPDPVVPTDKPEPVVPTDKPEPVVPTHHVTIPPTEPPSSTEDLKPATTKPIPTDKPEPFVPTVQPTTAGVWPTINVADFTTAPHRTTPAPVSRTCGKPQPRRMLHRIYGGMKAIPGANPWQASLQVRPKGSSQEFRHTCGAVLIESCWVLTAAHCISKNHDMQVVLGGFDLGKKEEFEQTIGVETVIVHEKYRETPEAVYNDIALLKLKSTNGKCAVESQYVKTLCLPNVSFPDGSECTIAGWGATEDSKHGSSQLMDAEVLLISQEKCSDPSVYGSTIDGSMFCAGYLQGGTDSCQGDSGGPLSCEKNGVHFLYGLVSWGDSCGKENKPGVYTNVIHFLDWINSKTGGIS